MSNIRTYFERKDNPEKLLIGPTPPRPGPILLKVAATAVNVVVKSKSSRLTIRTDAAKNQKVYDEIGIGRLNHVISDGLSLYL